MSDTDLIGCTPCKGRGKLLGLGSIQEDCSHCKGIGWIEKVSEKAEDEFLDNTPENMPTMAEMLQKDDLKVIDFVDGKQVSEPYYPNRIKKKAGRPKQAKA